MEQRNLTVNGLCDGVVIHEGARGWVWVGLQQHDCVCLWQGEIIAWSRVNNESVSLAQVAVHNGGRRTSEDRTEYRRLAYLAHCEYHGTRRMYIRVFNAK